VNKGTSGPPERKENSGAQYTMGPAFCIPSKDFLLLCDINETVGPVSRAKWTYIFSSPDPARYKEIIKNSPNRMYILPTWSELELMFVSADKPIGSWYENFVFFGGVPRYIFYPDLTARARNRLIQAVDEKGEVIAESFFKFGKIKYISFISILILFSLSIA
jgi:hypothetical protein